jgi:outer membrane beta-barrel protein
MPLARTHLLRLALSALAAIPLAASAQELPGLDLSQPEKPPPEEPRRPEPRATPTPAPGNPREEPGLDLAEPSRPESSPAAAPVLAGGETDAALADRVKAVQRKGFLKRGRFELGASVPATVNDAFYQKVGGGARLAYHLQDSFALRLRGDWFTSIRTGRAREGKIAFSSQLLQSELSRQVLLDGVWSPIYGKISLLGDRIVHFDVFLAAGLGLAWSATSFAPRSVGPHLATDVGGGLRFYPADWLALEAGLTGTFYPDQPVPAVPSTMQKVVAVNLAVSIFFPFGFEYRYP